MIYALVTGVWSFAPIAQPAGVSSRVAALQMAVPNAAPVYDGQVRVARVVWRPSTEGLDLCVRRTLPDGSMRHPFTPRRAVVRLTLAMCLSL